MSKFTCGEVLVLPNWRLMRTQLMMTLLYVETHVWRIASIAKLTSSAYCSWWWLCYMSKCTCGEVLVLLSRRLVLAAADDDFVICRNARVDKYVPFWNISFSSNGRGRLWCWWKRSWQHISSTINSFKTEIPIISSLLYMIGISVMEE